MNIGDKIFLLYTHRKTQQKTCDGPLTIVDFLDAPLNDEGTIVVKNVEGRTQCVNLEGTSSHEVDVHFVG